MDVLACSIVLVALSAPVWGIALKRAITRLLIRNLEKKTFDPQWIKETQHLRRQHGDRLREFPVATASAFAMTALVLALLFASGPEPDTLVVTFWKVFWYGTPAVSASLVAGAFYLHYSRRASRRLKYELFLIALNFLLFLNCLWVAALASGCLPALFAISIFVPCLIFVGLQVVALSVCKRITTHQEAVAAFYSLQAPALWLLALPYVIFRYHLLEKVAAHSILYFRSFRYQDAPAVFAKIIVPAARRFGVIEGLVHATQRSSDLQGSMEVTQQAQFSTSADEDWQSWVTGELRSASAVIIDAAGATNSLAWEIDQALTVVGPERVAILIPPGTEITIPEGVFRCEYALDRRAVRRARTSLKLWLRSLLFERRIVAVERMPVPS